MRISAVAIRDLYEQCGQTAEDWCLRLMARRPLSVMGPLLLIVREQPTLRSAVDAVSRFTALHHDAVAGEIDEFDRRRSVYRIDDVIGEQQGRDRGRVPFRLAGGAQRPPIIGNRPRLRAGSPAGHPKW